MRECENVRRELGPENKIKMYKNVRSEGVRNRGILKENTIKYPHSTKNHQNTQPG